ncbi:DNA repair protein RecO [Ancylobacter lacus]|uniref:DNA repair protein RecO n=1 Tax=Ancylobacter lacus TaxID=2579970 RepID=UPI001BCDF993|nr:DNA repair protein RecO [Ancylobacter lacus]MBS7537409.1 DNA repair protein RecO [Ancylobacter lacus]
MEWTDEGIILGLRRHGEGNAIVELMTAGHGRHLGLVRGGGSRRQAAGLQPGNAVRAVWRARIDGQLGAYTLETTAARADRLMASACASYAFAHLAALLRLLPERDPHPGLHAVLEAMMELLDAPEPAAMLVARFELLMLAELGFGLELDRCAATGGRNDLRFVSPKSGRAVSGEAAGPWRDQLFALPFFLVGDVAEPPDRAEIDAAYDLTGFFLRRRVLEPRGIGMPDSRAAFLAALARSGKLRAPRP